MARVGAPQATRDLCSAWWMVSGNGDQECVPAAELLSTCTRGSGPPDSLIDVSADTLVGGVTLLAEHEMTLYKVDKETGNLRAGAAPTRHEVSRNI